MWHAQGATAVIHVLRSASHTAPPLTPMQPLKLARRSAKCCSSLDEHVIGPMLSVGPMPDFVMEFRQPISYLKKLVPDLTRIILYKLLPKEVRWMEMEQERLFRLSYRISLLFILSSTISIVGIPVMPSYSIEIEATQFAKSTAWRGSPFL